MLYLVLLSSVAYTRDLLHLDCEKACSCEVMPKDVKMDLVVFDDYP